jgi:hypothetical protein
MTLQEAIAIVAERAIWAATRDIEWAEYGDIGHHDWQRVVDEIDRKAAAGTGNYQAAYALLASRATTEESL